MSETIKRSTVVELVRVYEEAEKNIRAGFALVASAEDALHQLLQAGNDSRFRLRVERGTEFSEPDQELDKLRRDVWRHLVERLELRRMMSIKKAEELDKWLKGEAEPITVESVMGLARHHVENLSSMLEEAVGEVYNFLRPERSKYKTNTEFELDRRVILSGWVERAWTGGGFQASHWRSKYYTALDNVFSALDGRGQVQKNWRSELELAISDAKEGQGQTRYFKFRACRNHNLHLEFLRPDLVEKFNRIAGGLRLKPGAGESVETAEAAE